MTRTLGWIAIAGLGLSLIFFVAAFMAGGNSFDFARRLVGDRPLAQFPGTKEWALNGDKIQVDLPANITITPQIKLNTQPSIVVRGRNDVVKNVMFGDGKLVFNGREAFGRAVNVDMRGVAVKEIQVSATGQVNLGHLDQDRLALRLSGPSQVSGDGHVGMLDIEVSGPGQVHLEGVKADRMRVRMTGPGVVTIAPQDEADIDVSGVGVVRLENDPKKLTTHVEGFGVIELASGKTIIDESQLNLRFMRRER